MILNIAVIILGLAIIFEYAYIFTVEHKHSDRIDRSREDIHDLQEYRWRVDDRMHDLKRGLNYSRDRVDVLYVNMDTLLEALHMQGIATEVKTEEVKVLVKPEDTDGEDSNN